MQKYLQFLSVVIFSVSCKEPYYPEIDHAEKMLVVDGLLSDESDKISVTLRNATPFRDQGYVPENGAYVVVSDNFGNDFVLTENAPGYYETNYSFHEYGRIYTLLIRTRNNKYYKSSPQTLFRKSEMEDVLFNITKNSVQSSVNGNMVFKTTKGLEFSTLLYSKSTESPFFRFSNTLLIEYLEKVVIWNPYSVSENFYCWKKYYPNQFFNLNDKKFNNLEQQKHTLGFCAVDSTYYYINDEDIWTSNPPTLDHTFYRDVYYFVITFKKQHLNEDVYEYYKAINDQLEAKNRIFDPVSFQVRGNIICENDPEEAVLGVFEVSSSDIRSYSFSLFLQDKSVKYEEVNPIDLESIAESGKESQFPTFWINNY